jgi:hypothetical protein
MASCPFAVDRNRSDVGSEKYLDIFHQNVHGLRTKSVEIFDVCSFDFKMICLMNMWLNESLPSQHFSPKLQTVYHSDRGCHTKLHGGGRALIAVFGAVFGVEHRLALNIFKNVYG